MRDEHLHFVLNKFYYLYCFCFFYGLRLITLEHILFILIHGLAPLTDKKANIKNYYREKLMIEIKLGALTLNIVSERFKKRNETSDQDHYLAHGIG
ncbi:hypothetical protein [Metabacillus sp. RGM 3146]|uniref:hypothetical protein n=1 Tax=Metabacillus sp. RGM 3146 TaxID=3401092 RepID=UPI003B9BB580